MTQTNCMKEVYIIVKSMNGKHETHTKVSAYPYIAKALVERGEIMDVDSVKFVGCD